jgi:hypothetical protein
MSQLPPVDHAEATELAGLYVLDALKPSLRSAVEEHLGACPDAHLEFDELGSVLPALALLVEPMQPPAALRARVMAAVQERR